MSRQPPPLPSAPSREESTASWCSISAEARSISRSSRCAAAPYQVLEINGDKWLGGDDFDHVIVQLINDWVQRSYDLDPSGEKAFLAKAKDQAQRAKAALSVQQCVEINVPLMDTFLVGQDEDKVSKQVDLEVEITREQFEAGIQPLVDRAMELVSKSLQSQTFTPDDISEVLLVGGSTAVPLVQQRVMEMFGRDKVKRHVNPMECVALGAAILASKFELQDDGHVDTTRADDAVVAPTAMHLGIAALRGKNPDSFVPIIEKGTPYPLPASREKTFYPTEENQRVIRVPVYEGLNELASLNELQGELEFPLADGIGANTPVQVSFNFDRTRILTVTVGIVGGDHKPFVETLRRDRARAKPSGKNKQELVDDWREELQPALRTARHFLDRYGIYMEPADRQEVEEACVEGDKALEGSDENNGRLRSKQLHNKLMACGTASQLFIAERVMEGAAPEYAQSLAKAIAELREAHSKGRTEAVTRICVALRMTVAQVLADRSDRRTVEDRQDHKGLLRVRD
jgi:molecular chaperone DnaK